MEHFYDAFVVVCWPISNAFDINLECNLTAGLAVLRQEQETQSRLFSTHLDAFWMLIKRNPASLAWGSGPLSPTAVFDLAKGSLVHTLAVLQVPSLFSVSS